MQQTLLIQQISRNRRCLSVLQFNKSFLYAKCKIILKTKLYLTLQQHFKTIFSLFLENGLNLDRAKHDRTININIATTNILNCCTSHIYISIYKVLIRVSIRKTFRNFCGTKRKIFLSFRIILREKKTTICAIIRKSHLKQNCPIPLLRNSSFAQFRNFVKIKRLGTGCVF